jgi:hypothetical protein
MAAGWHAAADGSDWAAIDGDAVEWGQAADSDTELSGPDPPQPADPGPPHIVREQPGSPGDNELTDGDELHPKRMGKFIMALCQDLDGNLWVGTEDTGVWRFSPNAENGRRWAQFARERTNGKPEPAGPTLPAQSADADCLGDNVAYALACDKLGRVWVGHLNHGVSVFDGAAWRNYDLLTGPLGERVFAIATSPADGDVWIATNAGLTRYRLQADAWTHYTRADGLPSDAIQCLALDDKGTIYAGTQCDGLAICEPARVDGKLEYKAWRVAAAPLATDDRPPVAACGDGLPTNLLNDVLAARDGPVHLATPVGLATSRDRGRTWTYLRGQDWEAKAKGFYKPPSDADLNKAAETAKTRTLLSEDFVTCLTEHESGNLWIGHREKYCEAFDPHKGILRAPPGSLSVDQPAAPKKADGKAKVAPLDYVTRILAYRGGYLAATYGRGLVRLTAPAAAAPTPPAAAAARNRPAAFPSPAAPPGLGELNALLAASMKISPASSGSKTAQPSPGVGSSPSKNTPLVVALPDDWRTEGDWLGRYGRHWACCCAICSPSDYLWGAGQAAVQYDARIGPHCQDNDSIRYWINWLYTDNRCCLEMPPVYYQSRIANGSTKGGKPRREAEWNDNSEVYPRTHEGPDLYCTLAVPRGTYVLSLYDHNKDGHEGPNRFRDNLVSIRLHAAGRALDDIDGFEQQPELARARIRDFWEGVWKRFLVQGPVQLTVRVSRMGSFNSQLTGVMLDPMEETPPPYFAASDDPLCAPSGTGVRASGVPSRAAPPSAGGDLAASVRAGLDALDELRVRHPEQWAACSRRSYALLLQAARQGPPSVAGPDPLGKPLVAAKLRGTCKYYCGLFPDWERDQTACGLTPAREIERALRWDGTRDMSGHGSEAVKQWLAQFEEAARFAVRIMVFTP